MIKWHNRSMSTQSGFIQQFYQVCSSWNTTQAGKLCLCPSSRSTTLFWCSYIGAALTLPSKDYKAWQHISVQSAVVSRVRPVNILSYLQGEDRKKWPPMKIGFLDYNCVKRAENVEKFINRTVQLPNMTEGLTLLNLKCNFHHTNR